VSQAGEKIMLNWGKQAQENKVPQLMKRVYYGFRDERFFL